MQPAPCNFYSQSGSGQPQQPQPLQEIPSTSRGSTTPSLPGVTLFNPSNTGPPGVFPTTGPPVSTPAYAEQSYFNSREPTPSMVSEPVHEASLPPSNPVHSNQELQGPPHPLSLAFQPVPPVTSSSQWAPDHGSRPPSVQNYFQPTSDPPTQPMHMQPYSQMFSPPTQSPQHNTHTPPALSGPPSVSAPLPHVGRPQYIESNTPQQPNTQPPMQNYFSQSANLSQLDSGYHQMGSVPSEAQSPVDSASLGASSAGPGPVSAHIPHVQTQESSTLSMFFKDDVENEETLTGEANKTVNGIAGSFLHHSNQPAGSQLYSGSADVVFDFHGTPLQPPSQMPYMNDESTAQGNNQKPAEPHYDHVENLECVPNEEVLPTERHSSPAAAALPVLDQYETGPNLETPDSAPRPMRSASVSSNYSNLSHGSGTGSRRHQGIMGTFIQQESPRLPDDVNQSATGGYFEQIDSTSTGDAIAQNFTENNWPPTPSPPSQLAYFRLVLTAHLNQCAHTA
ncbi:hypothetical protein WMY93_021797 [Mugilogobius chulae]|uniref:Uncharacterized protein n=1 Tax=Mugilogobius chulae TaxID=88201 RepID=A0AAW0NGN3_9GOBI